MKIIYILIGLFLSTHLTYGQKFLTKQGEISFLSETPIEDIKSENHQVLSVVDAKDGTIAIAILMKSFSFEKSLMQEHFNENYVESDLYPKATFKGKIESVTADYVGEKEVVVKGDITIHGITKTISINAELVKTTENIALSGVFKITIADFNIEIPSVVANNIAETMDVTFLLDHSLYQ
ncbi:YceI family protein [uncultured Maribacter sp.]|uniref:YceI family protein n=1 Tax=uncultured Maribacter sp. TaxID=431308 RepID=UPI002639B188|nr:YceI family protein [uncultured Maribacter sp.]